MDIKIDPDSGKPCIFNEKTGEFTPLIITAFTKKSKNAFGAGGWLAMSQSALEKIVNNKDLKLTDYRVFLLISSVVDYENYVLLSQVDLAERLGISKGTLGTSMKKLVDLGILIKGPKFGRNVSYRLAPTTAWKGTAKNHINAINEMAEEATEKAKKQSHLRVVEK